MALSESLLRRFLVFCLLWLLFTLLLFSLGSTLSSSSSLFIFRFIMNAMVGAAFHGRPRQCGRKRLRCELLCNSDHFAYSCCVCACMCVRVRVRVCLRTLMLLVAPATLLTGAPYFQQASLYIVDSHIRYRYQFECFRVAIDTQFTQEYMFTYLASCMQLEGWRRWRWGWGPRFLQLKLISSYSNFFRDIALY